MVMAKVTAKRCIEYFSTQTTIHGVLFFGALKLHLIERLLWVAVVTGASAGAISLSLSNWNRYSANPTVVSLRKDFRNWNNVFPSATACFLKRVDEKIANTYIKEKWNITSSDVNYDYYMGFIKTLANISYNTLDSFQKYESDKTLETINMAELIARVHPQLSGTLVTFDAAHKTNWQLVLGELGVCFSINSKFAHLFSYNINGTKRTPSDDFILKCHYLNGLCYARYDSDPLAPLKFYIHSNFDVAHATMESSLVVREGEELEINYRMQETTSAVSLRSLRPSQRKCRFEDEPQTNDIAVYSTSICYIICRYKMTLKLCGCRPFFYHKFGGKQCNITGLLCIAKFSEYITNSPSKIGCTCPQPCHMVSYLPQVPKLTKWEYGYFDRRITFRWGLLPPTTKYHRDILFGFEDLVVSFGGILALFLGVSFISVIETVFLIAECMLCKVKKLSTNHNLL